MKRLMKKFEEIMVAVTFAEAGEFETSKEMLGYREKANDSEEAIEVVSEPETV